MLQATLGPGHDSAKASSPTNAFFASGHRLLLSGNLIKEIQVNVLFLISEVYFPISYGSDR